MFWRYAWTIVGEVCGYVREVLEGKSSQKLSRKNLFQNVKQNQCVLFLRGGSCTVEVFAKLQVGSQILRPGGLESEILGQDKNLSFKKLF